MVTVSRPGGFDEQPVQLLGRLTMFRSRTKVAVIYGRGGRIGAGVARAFGPARRRMLPLEATHRGGLWDISEQLTAVAALTAKPGLSSDPRLKPKP